MYLFVVKSTVFVAQKPTPGSPSLSRNKLQTVLLVLIPVLKGLLITAKVLRSVAPPLTIFIVIGVPT